MKTVPFLALMFAGVASTAFAAKPFVLTDTQLDIGLTALPSWVDKYHLEGLLQWTNIPISPAPGRDTGQGGSLQTPSVTKLVVNPALQDLPKNPPMVRQLQSPQ